MPYGPEDQEAYERTTTHAVARAVAAERERCAKKADERAARDRELYKNENDWRMPYAFNRVVRASMDIAAAIRTQEDPAGKQA